MSMSVSAVGAVTPWEFTQNPQTGTGATDTGTASDAAAAPVVGSSGTAATDATELGGVFQEFATDLQSMLVQLQGSPASSATSDATATEVTGQAQTQQPSGAHHHHHHHGSGGDSAQSAGNQLVGEIAQLLGEASGSSASASGRTTTPGASAGS